jgi:predicted TIM-barrel fold metal-dependent hydrolase
LRHLPNLYFKWTTLNIDDLGKAGIPVPDFVDAAVRTFGPGKLMWGSDFGNSTRPDEGMLAEARNACRGLTLTERTMVLGDTGREVFLSRRQV